MTIAIIVGILLLAAAPLMWAMPSRRERELARLREAARRLGYTLQVTEVDHPSPTSEQQVSAAGKVRRPMLGCVAYRLPRAPVAGADAPDEDPDAAPRPRAPRTRITRRAGAQLAGLPEGWKVDDGFEPPDAALLALLPQLDRDVLAVESTGTTVALFWTERGGEDRLQQLTGLLQALMRDQQPR